MIRRKSILYLIAALFLFGPLIARSQDAAQSQNAGSNLEYATAQAELAYAVAQLAAIQRLRKMNQH